MLLLKHAKDIGAVIPEEIMLEYLEKMYLR
jgi:hypothetical protein